MALAFRLRRTLVAAAATSPSSAAAATSPSSLLRPVAAASLSQPLPLAYIFPLLLPGAAGGFQSRSAAAVRVRGYSAAATSPSSLLRPVAAASLSQSLPLAYIFPLLLPGAAGGFQLRSAAAVRVRGYSGVAEDKKPPYNGCDYKHWLIRMRFPDPQPSREEMIEIYLKTLAQVVGSYEEAKKRMYAFSTTTYIGFQAVMDEEMTDYFDGLPGVVFVLPDAYVGYKKEYGGDKYDNGTITEDGPPYPYWGKSSRPDKKRNLQPSSELTDKQ